jgi:hypothetical protein
MTEGGKDVDPVGNQALQMIHGSLPVGRSAKGAVQFALTQIVLELQRVAKAETVTLSRLPVHSLS